MRVGIDTLFEHPDRPSSAIDYLVNAVRTLPKVAPEAQFYVFTSTRNRHWFEEELAPNLELVNCGASNENVPLRILTQQTILPWKVKQLSIDILFSPGNVCPLVGDYCRVLKINTLHHYQTPQLIGRLRALYRRFSFSLSARRADCIVANSSSTRDEIAALMQVPREKISIVWEASFDSYRPMSETSVREVCRKHAISSPYTLFVSTLYPYKNVDILMQAYAQIVQRYPQFSDLVILGRDIDGEAKRLQGLAEKLDIRSRTHFLGFVDLADLPYFYSGARVFVYPSLHETFGKPLVEAMQCGAPIVASRVGAIPEVLGDAGVLVDPRNVDELATAIAKVAHDSELRSALVEKGLHRGAMFSWKSSAKQTMNVLLTAHAHRNRKHGGDASRRVQVDPISNS